MNKFIKRVLSVSLALLIAAGCFISSSAVEGMYGDIDANGRIDSADALLALRHSVNSAVLEGNAFVLADVNGDKVVDAADALEILKFAVGKISSFPVEETQKVPATKAEILAYYTKAVSDVRSAIPDYKLKFTTETIRVDMSGTMLEEVSPEELEAQKQSMMQKQVYNNLFRKGTESALANLPNECSVTDPSKFSDITCTVLENGNYQIDIKFKNEKNPTKNSVVVKMLGLPDIQTVVKQMEDEFAAMFEGEDIPMEVKVPTLKYENCAISCVINPETGEFVSYKVTSDMSTEVVMELILDLGFEKIVLADLKTDTTTRSVFEYSNFIY